MTRVLIWIAIFGLTLAILQLGWMQYFVAAVIAALGAVLLALLVLFLVWLLGTRSYQTTAVIPARIHEVWPLLRLSPSDDSWMEMIEHIVWDAGSETHATIKYKGGFSARFIQTFDDETHQLSGVVAMMDQSGHPVGDTILVNYKANAVAAGTLWTISMNFEAGENVGFVGWVNRLVAPFALRRLVSVVNKELMRRGAFERFRSDKA